MVIIYQWDKSKSLGHQNVAVTVGGTQVPYQVSFNIIDANSILVTGNGVFKYYKHKDNMLKVEHTGMTKKEQHISNHLTCHTWLPDGRAIVCTDQGELLLIESGGDYKMILNCSPGDGFYIEAIITYQKGFIIAGDTGQIMIFEKTDEPQHPYARLATLPTVDAKAEKDYPKLMLSIMACRIKSLALSQSEDKIVFTTENNQLMQVSINFERANEETKYEYLIYPFHSRAINGMDVCIKK